MSTTDRLLAELQMLTRGLRRAESEWLGASPSASTRVGREPESLLVKAEAALDAALDRLAAAPDIPAEEMKVTQAMRDAGGREILKSLAPGENYLDMSARIYRAMESAR